MTREPSTVRAIIVDDQPSQIEDIERNLKPALESAGYALHVVERFEDHAEANLHLVRQPNSVDLIVTDVLWPKSLEEPKKQDPAGLQVLRYAKKVCPHALRVALSTGDEDHVTIERDCINAGAHIVRLHGKDLPGIDGSGWIELGETIAHTIQGGRPYAKAPLPGVPDDEPHNKSAQNDLNEVVRVLRELPQSSKSMIRRRRNRPGIAVQDEYDVQDLCEIVLRSLYDDIRVEESGPSSVGSSSRMDFLVHGAGLAVEVKVATASHTATQIKTELLKDMNDYRRHPSVRVAVAAVYDFTGSIRNPRGFETDLSAWEENFVFEVIVVDATALVQTNPT